MLFKYKFIQQSVTFEIMHLELRFRCTLFTICCCPSTKVSSIQAGRKTSETPNPPALANLECGSREKQHHSHPTASLTSHLPVAQKLQECQRKVKPMNSALTNLVITYYFYFYSKKWASLPCRCCPWGTHREPLLCLSSGLRFSSSTHEFWVIISA